MRISRMLPRGHPAAAQQIARRTPQINAGVAVGVVNRSARGIYYWSVETASTVWLCLELGFVAVKSKLCRSFVKSEALTASRRMEAAGAASKLGRAHGASPAPGRSRWPQRCRSMLHPTP